MTITTIKEDINGDLYIDLPEDILTQFRLSENDIVEFIDNNDGSFKLKKINEHDSQLVLVECIQQYRIRYMVEVPKGKSEWALDTVVMEEASEFSQKDLGETIVSHRVVTKEELLNLCDKDNNYCKNWSNDKKFEVFVTKVNSDGTTQSFCKNA